jgi:hypothetical protein
VDDIIEILISNLCPMIGLRFIDVLQIDCWKTRTNDPLYPAGWHRRQATSWSQWLFPIMSQVFTKHHMIHWTMSNLHWKVTVKMNTMFSSNSITTKKRWNCIFCCAWSSCCPYLIRYMLYPTRYIFIGWLCFRANQESTLH